jgi:hypothetical protein
MERDLLVMIYGAIMGVTGSIVTSIVTALFQFWLARREYERRQTEDRERQLKRILLPTDEEVRMINSEHDPEHAPDTVRTLAEVGVVLLSMLLTSAMVYQVKDPRLGFIFGACLGFLVARRITKAIIK